MPTAPLKPCQQLGCKALVPRGYCADHGPPRPPPGLARINPHRHLYNRRWEKARRIYLIEHPLCVDCDDHGLTEPATEVDHIVPHRGDPAIFWNTDNWQALCKPCHSRKTASHDGGFANQRGIS